MEFSKLQSIWDMVYKNGILPWENTQLPMQILTNFVQQLKNKTKSPKVLDFGCGKGRLAKELTKQGCDVYYYDVSHFVLDEIIESGVSRDHIFKNIKEINHDYFDGILCWSVFHNISPEGWLWYLGRFHNFLNSNGILLLSAFTNNDFNYRKSRVVKSDIIGQNTFAVNMYLDQDFFNIELRGVFEFTESGRAWERTLDYFIAKKRQDFVITYKNNILNLIKEKHIVFSHFVMYNFVNSLNDSEHRYGEYYDEEDEISSMNLWLNAISLFQQYDKWKNNNSFLMSSSFTHLLFQKSNKRFSYLVKSRINSETTEIKISYKLDDRVCPNLYIIDLNVPRLLVANSKKFEELYREKKNITFDWKIPHPFVYDDYSEYYTQTKNKLKELEQVDLNIYNYKDDTINKIFNQIDGQLNQLPLELKELEDAIKMMIFFVYPTCNNGTTIEEKTYVAIIPPSFEIKSKEDSSNVFKEITAGGAVIYTKGNPFKDDTDRDYFFHYVIKWSSAYATKSVATYIQKESLKSAKAAIMSRNFSHNIGSHIMAYIKQGLLSTESLMEHKVLENLVSHKQPLEELYGNMKGITFAQVKADYDKLINDDVKNALILNSNQPNLVEMPYLVGLGRFLSYLQERQDFIATIASDYIPYPTPVNFKEAIYDELNPDLRYLRHADSMLSCRRPKNLLLSYIAKSEGYERPDFFSEEIDQQDRKDDIVIKFGKFDGINDVNLTGEEGSKRRGNLYHVGFGKGALDLAKMKRYDIGFPGGNSGRQALFSILENFIRNVAKHGEKEEAPNDDVKYLAIEIELFDLKKEKTKKIVDEGDIAQTDPDFFNEFICFKKDGEGEDSIITEDNVFATQLNNYYFKSQDSDDLYLMTLSSNTLAKAEEIWQLQENLKEPFLKEDGSINQKCKGLKEMRISAAWIRRLDVHDVAKGQDPNVYPYHNQCPIITIAAKKMRNAEITDKKFKFFYLICLPKAKVMAYISKNITNKEKDDITFLTFDEFKSKANRCFDIICAEEDSVKYDIVELIGTDKRVCVSKYTPDLSTTPDTPSNRAKNFIEEQYKSLIDKKGDGSSESLNPIIIDDNLFSDSLKGDGINIITKNLSGKVMKIVMESTSPTQEDVKFEENYFYIKHLETQTEFTDFLRKLNGYDSEGKKNEGEGKEDARPAFAEAISGANSTDRLIRSTVIDKKWYYKHLHAMKSNVAIFDERLFHYVTGLDENSVFDGTSSHSLSKHLPVVYAFKNVYAFLLKYNDNIESIYKERKKGGFDIYGYNGYVYAQHSIKIEKVGTVKLDENSVVKMEWIEGSIHEGKTFDLFSIHQGLLDKLYVKLGKTEKSKREEVTKALYQGVIGKNDAKKDATAELQEKPFIYSGMTIHSGRSKPSEDDMPQHIPFIQYAAIENAFMDCKYTLVELLELAQYEQS